MATNLMQQIKDLCASEVSEMRLFERAVDCIFEAAEYYDWVGIYRVEGGELILAGWRGPQPTEHVRIPLEEGICGFVATEGETVRVHDVNADPRYLACFVNTKSEMVVPIKAGTDVIAEIDIDSDSPSAFRDRDQEQLEAVAGMIGKRVAELRG